VTQTHIEGFDKQIKTYSYILFVPFCAIVRHALKRNGVAVVGGSNPLAPTIFQLIYSLFTRRERE